MLTTMNPRLRTRRLSRSLLLVPLLAALLAAPAMLAAPVEAAIAAGPAPAAVVMPAESGTCVAWPLPDSDFSFMRIAGLVMGAIARAMRGDG